MRWKKEAMTVGHSSRKARVKFWQVLRRRDLDKLHEDTMVVLEDVGVEVMHDEALALLAGAGASVDGRRARIPRRMVEEAIKSAPKAAAVYDRDGRPAMKLSSGHVYFGTGSDVVWYDDPAAGRRMPTSRESIAAITRLSDALPNIDFVMSMGVAHGTPAGRLDQTHFALMVENTAKPIIFTSQSRASMADIIAMATAVRGGPEALRGKPFCILYAMPTSPLLHTQEALDVVMLAARAGIPVIYVPGAICGGTGPVTIAGSAILGNAETLSGLVIHQLFAAGAPFVHGPIASPLDMRTMVNLYNGPASMLAYAAGSELARRYRLPAFQIGGASDSKVFDQQAASEAAMSLMTAALTGGTIIHDVGYLESGLQASPCLLTWCDEVIDQIRFMLRGVAVSDEDDLVGAIRDVGPRGSFLTHESTLTRFRESLWEGRLHDARPFDQWAAGSADALARARQRTLEILATHQPKPLDADVRARLSR
ncbi:MAG: trimethylamine methyltransferase family protein [Phycisphaerae bacterium]